MASDTGINITEGWPWPWPDSRTTDFAYGWIDSSSLFGDGQVLVSRFGRPWETLADLERRETSGTDIGKMSDDEVRRMGPE